MQLQVTGIHIDVGDALRVHVSERMEASVGKYFDRPVDAHVTFQREGHGFRAECTVHLSSGMTLNTQNDASEVYAAFDGAVERLDKRLRRYKRRLKDHHNTQKSPLPAYDAPTFVLAAEREEEEQENHSDQTDPIVIAEGTTKVPVLSVSDAVMQMDISESPFVIFRNGDGGINLVYRRDDGHVGWIDASRKPNED
ncbi:ribosome hibernation-promoting factor, HPF/YfiA family [Tepidicaulis sp.]|uniref:ribosome hibernation-promoting factor, HPF/YfiA family n=1 Tax=Tepidicaulis sp. TaxID=1920809 RepID=UPI003B5B1CCC